MASRFFKTEKDHFVFSCFRGFLIVGVLCAAAFAQAPDRTQTEALARRATDRLQALQREADRLASDERTLLGDLRKLEVERQIKAGELKQIDDEIGRVQTERAATVARMDALQSAADAERPRLRARVVEIYKLGQQPYLRLLLSTSDFRRVGQASRTVAALAVLDRE